MIAKNSVVAHIYYIKTVVDQTLLKVVSFVRSMDLSEAQSAKA